MLTELSIRNLAVIENVTVSFGKGFHVLTGETGAGKSIVIDALSLIAGARGAADLVRYGADKAEIEALFELESDHPAWEVMDRIGIESDRGEHLIIRREVTNQGKSTSRINGHLVNLSMLRELGESLVNIHGQHEHQSLLKVEGHIRMLDLYGEETILDVKEDYGSSYQQFQKLTIQIEQLQETTQQALQLMDLYRFQVEEISAAHLKIGEDESLWDEKRKLANAEKLMDAVSSSYDSIYGSKGLDAIGKAMNRLEDIVPFDPLALQPLHEQIQSAFYQLEDASHQLRNYRDQIEFNPERLEEIEQRLDLLSNLRRKYGNGIEGILEHLEKLKKELDVIENKDEVLQQLQANAHKLLTTLVRQASQLSELRHHVAERLASQIETELRDLHMERTRFKVQIGQTEDPKGWEANGQKLRFTKDGWDQVEFLISANPGEPLRPLHKIASGGELSRIMLALKSIFAEMDRIPVLVFDEVDTGVSGRAAQAIAEKISRLSGNCQVFAITHLPQVACMADAHYLINKQVSGDRTYTMVNRLDERGRIEELARMLGGVEVTETTLQHAKEMIEMANGIKQTV